MWNIFKTKPETITVKKVIKPTVDNSIIKESIINSAHIQKDIKQSFDKVLAEFDLVESKETTIEILQEQLNNFKEANVDIYNKSQQLIQLGFINTPSASKLKKELEEQEIIISGKIKSIENDIKSKQELQTLISQYAITYPLYKFIDSETMTNIMRKYDLVLGDVSLYSKEIPNDSLELIGGFSKHIIKSNMFLYEKSSRYSASSYIITSKILKDDKYDWYNKIQDISVSNLKMIAPESHFTIPTIDIYQRWDGEYNTTPIAKINPKTKHYEYNLDEVNEIAKKNREILDPIAVLEVKRGYIIIDAWDEEANIPEIQNGLLN